MWERWSILNCGVRGVEQDTTHLSSARDGVCQRSGEFDLQENSYVDQEASNSSDGHDAPEVEIPKKVNLGSLEEGKLAREPHEREENNGGQEGIIVQEPPLVVVHNQELLLDVDAVKGHEAGGAHSVEDPLPREVDLTISSHKKARQHNDTGEEGAHRGVLAQDDVCEHNVKHNAERASNLRNPTNTSTSKNKNSKNKSKSKNNGDTNSNHRCG